MPKNKKTKKAKAAAPALKFARFLPALVLGVAATLLWAQPYLGAALKPSGGNDVLAYATNVSISGLLSATNSQRNANGAAALALHSKLNAAAQAKANDMTARDYWAHVTPDGKQPWWFITNAGYKYLAAGENLAYGFMTSGDTISGWMNSTLGHRENMLNTTFTEVGFGIANSANYVGKGPQTVVVAMYAKPQAVASVPVAPATTPTTQTKPATAPISKPTPAPVAAVEPEPEPTPTPAIEERNPEQEPIAIADTTTTAAPTRVSRIQVLTGGSAIWSATFVILAVLSIGLLWLVHKGFHFRRYLVAGEHFFMHHIHLDLTVLAVMYLGIVLLSSSGTIR